MGQKTIRFATSVLAIYALCAEVSAQQSYPLVCRGGGNLYFNYTPFSNFSRAPQIWINFEPGSQGVGNNWERANTLAPGQCSWLDRPLRGGEPTRILITEPILQRDHFSIAWSKGKVMGISSALTYVNALGSDTGLQSFDVYNDSRGNMVVTRIGQQR